MSSGDGMSQSLVGRYDDRIAGVLSCYDRIVITGPQCGNLRSGRPAVQLRLRPAKLGDIGNGLVRPNA
jgi:hypothetical protein